MGFPQPSLETVPRESDLFLALAQLSLVRHPNTLEPLSDNEMGNGYLLLTSKLLGRPLSSWTSGLLEYFSKSSPLALEGEMEELRSQAVLWGVPLAAGKEEGNFLGILLHRIVVWTSLPEHGRAGLFCRGGRWVATASL